MENKKKTEPILPPDIQRLIDEIEGVIPPEEPKPVKKEKTDDVPHENMGKVADELRIDDDLELDDSEDYWTMIMTSRTAFMRTRKSTAEIMLTRRKKSIIRNTKTRTTSTIMRCRI